MSDSIVIVGASRTPMGSFQGELASLDASDLGGSAIAGALTNAGIDSDTADEVIMGCCLPAGQGQAPARQAAFKAGLPENIPATTLNKMCGSGMKTTMVAYDQLRAGNGEIVIAGGMESMSNAPYLLPKMRDGARLGHGEVIDHMFLDGLEDAYDKGRLMGTFAEECAEKYQFTRQAQDAFALRSLENANKARKSGAFDNEIAPITIKSRKGEIEINSDESPRKAMPEKIPNLRPAFKKDGTVTAANASSISDGAAALVLMRESDARKQGLKIRARILGHASHAQAPNWFTTAPVPAINKLLEKIGWKKDDVDLWEINEAFAVVPMAAQVEIGIDPDKVNVHGGACAVGHPIGASGARIIVTLLNALESKGLKKGMAGICIGGGEGTAIAIELN
ncbi:MAG: acetyl-CoA C-acyltransferase [Hyphomicrobiales bacterium]|nr:acetyl-CoA C-acyltransferase [Hyphomicrobiales bacterium]